MSLLKLNVGLCVLFVALAMVATNYQTAQAETITLSCLLSSKAIYVIDTSAGTVKGDYNGTAYNCTDVAISDGTISFVYDIPNVVRTTSQIDRTTGIISDDIYYYPQSGGSGPSRAAGQCTKIPDKAF